MSEGFLQFVSRMPLASVDELSDDNTPAPVKPVPKPGLKDPAKLKMLPKAKVKSSSSRKVIKDDTKKETKKKTKKTDKDPDPLKGAVLKRPSALRKPVGKCFYKQHGVYGFKIDKQQVMTVPWLFVIHWNILDSYQQGFTHVHMLVQAPTQRTCLSTQSLIELSSRKCPTSVMKPMKRSAIHGCKATPIGRGVCKHRVQVNE